jgi:CHASE2 domain-containing sensor protein
MRRACTRNSACGWQDRCALAYRAVYGVLGSYVTARLAPDRPTLHAMTLGVVGVVIGSVGAVVMWDAGPAWYSLGVIAVTLPCARAGAWLHERRRRGEADGGLRIPGARPA